MRSTWLWMYGGHLRLLSSENHHLQALSIDNQVFSVCIFGAKSNSVDNGRSSHLESGY